MPPTTRRKPKPLTDENADVPLKRKRTDADADSDAPPATRKRSALDDKSCNSSDISLLQAITTPADEPDLKKPPPRHKSLLGGDPILPKDFPAKSEIHQLLEPLCDKFNPEEYETLLAHISSKKDTSYQAAADLISSKRTLPPPPLRYSPPL